MQSKLMVSSPKKKHNVNIVNNNYDTVSLNSFPYVKAFKIDSKSYMEISSRFKKEDYIKLQKMFINNPIHEDPNILLSDFITDATLQEYNRNFNNNDDFYLELNINQVTLNKINDMVFYYEKTNHEPISVNDFIVIMVDELYDLKEDAYVDADNRLEEIAEMHRNGVDENRI